MVKPASGGSPRVELADHRGNIGFEKSDPDHNQRQREVEDRQRLIIADNTGCRLTRRLALKRHAEMPRDKQ